jgi:hypothetical protein
MSDETTHTQDHQRGNTAAQVRTRYVFRILRAAFPLNHRPRRAPAVRQKPRSDALEEPPHDAHAHLIRTGPRCSTPDHQLGSLAVSAQDRRARRRCRAQLSTIVKALVCVRVWPRGRGNNLGSVELSNNLIGECPFWGVFGRAYPIASAALFGG